MKIAYICEYDSSDINSWSGTNLFIKNALTWQGAEVYAIDKLENKRSKWLKIKKLLYNATLRRFQPIRDIEAAKAYAQQIEERLLPNTDAIIGPSSVITAFLSTNIPTFFYTDATFDGMLGYYNEFKQLCAETLRDGEFLEQKAIDTVAMAFYSSQWAADSAINHYKKAADKVKVIPFGANIYHFPNEAEITEIIQNRPNDVCRLLFIGTNFERKGGETLIETADELTKRGMNVEVHLVGLEAVPPKFQRSYLTLHGFVNKNNTEGEKKFYALLNQSHFLMVPSLADCSPIVYSEASAFGLPVVARKTGGVPSMITQDKNGGLFENDKHEYADFIERYFKNYPSYQKLARSTYDTYLEKLNWEVAGKSLITYIKETIEGRKAIN